MGQPPEVSFGGLPRLFLCAVEHRMISRNELEFPCRKPGFHLVTMFRRPDRWGHHILRCDFEIRVPDLRLLLRDGACDSLTNDVHSPLTSSLDLLHRIDAHHMHHIQRSTCEVRQSDRTTGCLAFQDRRSGERVPLGPSNPCIDHPLLSDSNRISILRVHHRHQPLVFTHLHSGDELLVCHHQSSFIREEEFKTVDASVRKSLHISAHLVVPCCDRHVEAVVHHTLGCLLLVHFVSSKDVSVHWEGEVDVESGAPGQSRLLPALEVVTGLLAHERHFKMCVRVDSSREDILPASVNYIGTFRSLDDPRFFKFSDLATLDEDISNAFTMARLL
mmetsp:Transcript_26868/g.32628  ORF Transcript_26868/g.32628 Transcript_26868/m.32628 type:complete len:332 (+) Transcript_26868:2-997(+)